MFKRKIGRPSNSEIKKRRIIKVVALSIAFIAILSITYTLTNINTKRLKGESDYYGISCEEGTACYQAGFRNGNLYQRVIDSYNEENSASLSYGDVITDKQLATITSLSASNANIDDATGIEKLVNLEELYLENNNVSEINISNLTNLICLDLYNNNLSEINVNNLTNLEYLNLSSNNLSETNVNNLTNLEHLNLSSNNLSEINVSNLRNLTDLHLSNNYLSTIDLSNIFNLEKLDLSNNNLNEVDLSHNTNLMSLYLEHNNLNTIDLSSINRIEKLSLDINLYSMVDFNRVKDYAELENNFILLQGEEVNINPLLNQFEIESGIYHEDVISYNDGIISALKEGYGSLKNSINNSYYDAYFMVLDKIESSKYNVDNDEKYIYVSDDIDDEIKSNLTIDNKYILYKECEYRDNNPTDEEANECVNYMKKRHIGYKFNINKNNMKLVLTSKKDSYVIKYQLGRIDLSNYEVNEKEITVNGAFNYEEIPYYNVTLEYSDNTLIVKDLNGNEVDRYTVNISGNNDNNTTKSSNIEESTTKIDEEKTSKKTTLNKFEKNAKTYDDIVKYFIIGSIAIILIIGIIIYTKRKK